MDDEELIEEVRKYSELYDMSNRKYSDNVHKEKTWNKIAEKLYTTGCTCKMRWISLRDQLRKSLKKKVTKSGQAAKKQKTWRFEDCMSFVVPFFKERDTLSSIAATDNSDAESSDGVEFLVHYDNDVTLGAAEKIVENESVITPKNKKTSKTTPSPKNSTPHPFNIRKTSKTDTASSVLMKYLLESDKKESEPASYRSYDDSIEKYFSAIAATVRKFQPEYQHLAKSQVFSIVSELEWEQLKSETLNIETASPRSSYDDMSNMVSKIQTKGYSNIAKSSVSHVKPPTPSSSQYSGASSVPDFLI